GPWKACPVVPWPLPVPPNSLYWPSLAPPSIAGATSGSGDLMRHVCWVDVLHRHPHEDRPRLEVDLDELGQPERSIGCRSCHVQDVASRLRESCWAETRGCDARAGAVVLEASVVGDIPNAVSVKANWGWPTSGYLIWLMLPSWETQTLICTPSTVCEKRKPLGGEEQVPPSLGTSTRG